MSEITDAEFAQFQRFIHEAAGITLASTKKPMVHGRLRKRLHARQITSFSEYLRLLRHGTCPEELQIAVDLLTTNETYFFREPKHFDRLREAALASRRDTSFRVWSAASSSGEEAYSVAMVLEDSLPGHAWEVIGSDISARVIAQARAGHYRTARLENMPPGFLRRFCLKGTGPHEGTLLIARQLRERVHFREANLIRPLPSLGSFDVVFLRNVLIYFDQQTRRAVVARVLATIKPGGLLFVGHSESLSELTDEVQMIAPSIFRKPR